MRKEKIYRLHKLSALLDNDRIYNLHKIAQYEQKEIEEDFIAKAPMTESEKIEQMIQDIKGMAEKNEPIKIGEKDSEFYYPYISFIQKQLIRKGFDNNKYPFNIGTFDVHTEEAISIIQESEELNITGELDRDSIDDVFSNKSMKPFLDKIEKDLKQGAVQTSNVKPDSRYDLEKFNRIPAGADSISPEMLFNDLFSQIKNKELVAGIIGNAYVESGLIVNNAGDEQLCSRTDKCVYSPYKKMNSCSFGLWQYNICGGLGEDFLSAHGNPKDEDSKLEILQDYNKQVDFIIKKVLSYTDIINKRESPEWFAEWFCKTIERPSEAALAKSMNLRTGYARSVYNKLVGGSDNVSHLDGNFPRDFSSLNLDTKDVEGLSPGTESYLYILNYYAKQKGIKITITSGFRNSYNQTRVMLNNFKEKGGTPSERASYLIGLYGKKVSPIVSIFNGPGTDQEKITNAEPIVKQLDLSSHLRGESIDIDLDKNKSDLIDVVNKTRTHADIKILDEGDHLHVTVKSLKQSPEALAEKGSLPSSIYDWYKKIFI